jgi:hypothetical protein
MTTAAFAPPAHRAPEQFAKVIPLESTRAERLPQWLPEVVERINKLARLPAPAAVDAPAPPTEAAATSALDAMRTVMWFETPTPSVVPMYDGGLQLEWHAEDVDIEVTVMPSGERRVWIEVASGLEIDEPFRTAAEELRKLLGSLRRR